MGRRETSHRRLVSSNDNKRDERDRERDGERWRDKKTRNRTNEELKIVSSPRVVLDFTSLKKVSEINIFAERSS